MKGIHLIIGALLINLAVQAQTIKIEGKITDQNNKPIEYASIGLIGTTMGTVSNTEGGFVFKVPYSYKDKIIIVSTLGYETFSITVSEIKNNYLKIQLDKKVYDLSEIVIKPEEAEDVVRKALENIPTNYPTEPINMEGFYREMTFENDTCVELAEAACEFYYSPYNEMYNRKEAFESYFSKGNINMHDYFYTYANTTITNPKDQLSITEVRASDLHHKHRFKVIPNGGPFSLVGYDWIKQNNSFKNGNFIKNHKFKILDIITNDNKQAYKIYCEPKSVKKTYHYILYVDTETYAIAMIEEYFPGIKSKRNSYWTPALYKKRKQKCNDVVQDIYFKVITKYNNINHKWYLSYVKSEHKFEYIFSKHYVYKEQQDKISYYLQSELLINNIRTKNVQKIPDSTNFKNSHINVLYEYDLTYNKPFWDNYNTIALTPVQDSIIKQLEKYQSIENQYSKKFLKDDNLEAPVADEIPCINPTTNIADDYYWMQNLKNPEVLKYVEKENHYTKNYMLSLEKTKRNLFFEMISRNVNDTARISNKVENGKYEYYYKQEIGANYANIYRNKIGENEEELILNIARKAQYNPSYWAEIESINPENTILAFNEPITSGYNSRVILKNLQTGENLDSLYKASSIIWKKNNQEFLYINWDETNRVDKLFAHKLGTKQEHDKLIYYEKNNFNSISLGLYDKKYVLLESSNDFYYNSVYTIDLEDKNTVLKEIVPYKEGYSHSIHIESDTLYSLTNEPNGKTVLYYSCMNNPDEKYWEKLIENTNNYFFSGYKICGNYIVLLESGNMQTHFKIIDKKGNTVKTIEFDEEETYTIRFKKMKDLPENTFRYNYSSLATPPKIFEYNIEKDETSFIKQETINGYIAKYYKTELTWATSKDGVKVPISVVYNKKRAKLNGKSPLYLTTYGSYGSSTYTTFNPTYLSLLDRGIIVALAHVRGGSELGEKWHEDAMQMKKTNTFDDFIACAEHLINTKYTSKGKIIASGGSAGGLVMGVAANQRPGLFNTIILGAAYLDVLGTITDTTAKFVFEEREGEIGNPENPEMFEYIKSYSPYQNIAKQDYPHMLFTMGLNDTRVEYWQTLKTVARLRKYKSDDNTLLLKTDLYAGHSGYTGKYAYMAEDAFIFAFILNNLNIRY